MARFVLIEKQAGKLIEADVSFNHTMMMMVDRILVSMDLRNGISKYLEIKKLEGLII